MRKTQLNRYHKLLTEKRAELCDRVRAVRATEKDRTSKDAPDLGDRAISTMSRDLLYMLSTTERDILRRVDLAIERVEDKTFGVCVNCEKKIQQGRLDAVPWARHCIECQELQDRGEL